MLLYERLKKKPSLLRSLSGFSLPQMMELARRMEPLWEKEEEERHTRRKRERRMGAGHPYHLPTMADKLLLLLLDWRHALTHELLGCLFDLDQSNVTRLLQRLTPLVESAADPQLKTFLRTAQKQRKKISTMEEFLTVVPELREILGDTTEQQRQRPHGKRKQKKYYSGKKKRHTLKTEIIATPSGRILHVSKSYPGRVHDRRIHEEEKIAAFLPKETRQYYDKGYEGVQFAQPDHDIRLPYKRKSPGRNGKGMHGPPLTRGQKQANTLRAKRRIKVEHVFSRMKKFRILSVVYRNAEESYNVTFRGVAALLNFRLSFAG
jgi:hypothetical protein